MTLTEEKREEYRADAERALAHGKVSIICVRPTDLLALLAEPLTPAEAGAIQAVAEVEQLRRALTVVAEWKPETFPRVPDRDDPTKTYSYSFAYGSNGERDFMRDVAQKALDSTTPTEPVFTATQVREAVTRVQSDAKRAESGAMVTQDLQVCAESAGREKGAGEMLSALGLAQK